MYALSNVYLISYDIKCHFFFSLHCYLFDRKKPTPTYFVSYKEHHWIQQTILEAAHFVHCKEVSTICWHLQSTFNSVALSILWLSGHSQHLYKASIFTSNFGWQCTGATGRMSDFTAVTQWVGGRARTANQESWLQVPCPAYKPTFPLLLEHFQI